MKSKIRRFSFSRFSANHFDNRNIFLDREAVVITNVGGSASPRHVMEGFVDSVTLKEHNIDTYPNFYTGECPDRNDKNSGLFHFKTIDYFLSPLLFTIFTRILILKVIRIGRTIYDVLYMTNAMISSDGEVKLII